MNGCPVSTVERLSAASPDSREQNPLRGAAVLAGGPGEQGTSSQMSILDRDGEDLVDGVPFEVFVVPVRLRLAERPDTSPIVLGELVRPVVP